MDLAGGTWVSPPGAGAILSSLIDTEIYFHVLDATATTLDARIAFGDGSGAQELCATTLDIPGGDFTANPHFVVAEQTALWQCTVALNMSDVEYSGAFRATLDAVEVGRFAAEVEVGQLSALLGGDSCKLLATVGFSCTPCTYLQSQDCLEMEVTSMTWSEVAVPIVQRTSSDLANDPNCSTTTTSTPTQSGGTGSPATP